MIVDKLLRKEIRFKEKLGSLVWNIRRPRPLPMVLVLAKMNIKSLVSTVFPLVTKI